MFRFETAELSMRQPETELYLPNPSCPLFVRERAHRPHQTHHNRARIIPDFVDFLRREWAAVPAVKEVRFYRSLT